MFRVTKLQTINSLLRILVYFIILTFGQTDLSLVFVVFMVMKDKSNTVIVIEAVRYRR